jgi:hypothetical protein
MLVYPDFPAHDEELVHVFFRLVWRPLRPLRIAQFVRDVLREVRKGRAADAICEYFLEGLTSKEHRAQVKELVNAVHTWLQSIHDGTWGMKYRRLLDLLDAAVLRAARAGTYPPTFSTN